MLEFNLPAISCGHCAGAVTQAVKEVDPAATVEVDIKGKKAMIDSTKDRQVFADALTEAGYPPAMA